MQPLFRRAARKPEQRIDRAIACKARQQRNDADQFGIVPKASTLIHEEPNKQRRANDNAKNTVKISFIGGEHDATPFRAPSSLVQKRLWGVFRNQH